MTRIQSMKSGDTAAKRCVVTRTTSEGDLERADAEPHALNTQGADYIHVFAKFSGTQTTATVVPWAYSPVSGEWHALDPITLSTLLPSTDSPSTSGRVELRGHDKICLAIHDLDGDPDDEFKLWLGYSYEVRPSD